MSQSIGLSTAGEISLMRQMKWAELQAKLYTCMKNSHLLQGKGSHLFGSKRIKMQDLYS